MNLLLPFATVALLALLALPNSARGVSVTFGNFGPGVDSLIPSGGGSILSVIRNVEFGAVAFSVGSQPIESQSIDLGMRADFGSPAGFLLGIADQDFPTSGGGPVLLGWFVRKRRSQPDSRTDSQTDAEA